MRRVLLAVWLVKQEFVRREKGDTMLSFYQIQDLGIIITYLYVMEDGRG